MMRVLNLIGLDVSRAVVPSKNSDTEQENYKGFFEHRLVFFAHENALQILNMSWKDLDQLPKNWLFRVDKPYKELKNIVQREFSKSSLWGVKDPRMCRLLPMWIKLTQELNVIPNFIIMVRNVTDVVKSLHKWNKIPEDIALILWTRYVVEAELWSRGFKRIFVTFDQLINDYKQVLDRISVNFGIVFPIDVSSVRSEIENFLDSKMVHFNNRFISDQIEIPSCIENLHGNLISLATKHTNEAYLSFLNNKKEFLTLMSTPKYKKIINDWKYEILSK
jgi:hypothetical protein